MPTSHQESLMNIASGAEKHLASPTREVASADCAKVGGVNLIIIRLFANPSVVFADSSPKGAPRLVTADLGSMWSSTPTNCVAV